MADSSFDTQASAADAATDTNNPWPGLAPFTEDQSGLFHGRDAEIRDLSRRIERNALTVLFGQSGLGKSSLLQAGVFPRVRAAGYCPIYVRLDHAPGAPSPTEQVKAMVLAGTGAAGTWARPEAPKAGETLWEFLHHRDNHLRDASGRTIIPVLVFDQFEELFTLGAGTGAERDRAVAFMSELAELVENRPSEQLVARLEESQAEMDDFDFGRTDYRVVISLREDYLPHLEGMKTIMPALMQNRMRLTQMTGAQALDAVLKPGRGLVTEDVARAIVEFVAGARGGSLDRLAEVNVEPPLLSVICRELNERRRALGQAQITADLVSGNRREILNDFYERSVADLPEEMRRFVEDKLLTKSGFRDNIALETALEEPGVTRPLLDTLVARRLLRIEDRIGTQRVELTHDVLADVVRASRDSRQQRLLVQQAEARERAALAEARRRSVRQRWIIGGLSAAVVALGIGAMFGFRARTEATRQKSQLDLEVGSRLLDEGKFGEGMAYLVRAGRTDPRNDLVATRLLTALAERNFFVPTHPGLTLPAATESGVFTSDGRRFVARGDDDIARVLDASTWKLERQLEFGGVGIVRDGLKLAANHPTVFAALLANSTLVVGDLETGQLRFPPIRITEPVVANRRVHVLLSPDGRWLAAAGAEAVSVWDANSGELKATLPNGTATRWFAFSPDGARLVTVFADTVRRAQQWAIPSGQPVGPRLTPPPGAWHGAHYSSDGTRLIMVCARGATVFDAEKGTVIRELPLEVSSTELRAMPTPDGSALIVRSANAVTVTDLATGAPRFAPLAHPATLAGLGTSADGKRLLTTCIDGYFRLWDLQTGQLLAEPTFRQPGVVSAVLSSDGQFVALAANSVELHRLKLGPGAAAPLRFPQTGFRMLTQFDQTKPAALLWFDRAEANVIDIASGREVAGGFTYPEPVAALRVATYGHTLAWPGMTIFARTPSGMMKAWTLGEGGFTGSVDLGLATGQVGTYDHNPGGNLMCNYVDASLRVWNVRTGQEVAKIAVREGFQPAVGRVCFNNNETRLAYVTPGGSLAVCKMPGADEWLTIRPLKGTRFSTHRFSPDDRQIITGDDLGNLQIYEADSGKLLRSTQGHRDLISRLEFSRDNRFYASAADDASVQIWSTATHERVGPLLQQSGLGGRAAFSPDSRQLSAAAGSSFARIWDVETGVPLAGPLAHGTMVTQQVAYAPNGKFLSITGASARFIWAAPPQQKGQRTPEWLLALAAAYSGHELSETSSLTLKDGLATLHEIRAVIGRLVGDDPYVAWGRWIVADGADRPIAPGFTVTPQQATALESERQSGDTTESIRATTLRAQDLIREERWAEVEPLQQRAIEAHSRNGDSVDLSSAYIYLSIAQRHQQKFEAAIASARESLRLRQKLLPVEDRLITSAREHLGYALAGAEQYEEAEIELLAAHDRYVRSGRVVAARPVAAALARLYEALDEPGKVEEWLKKASRTPNAAGDAPPDASKSGAKGEAKQ